LQPRSVDLLLGVGVDVRNMTVSPRSTVTIVLEFDSTLVTQEWKEAVAANFTAVLGTQITPADIQVTTSSATMVKVVIVVRASKTYIIQKLGKDGEGLSNIFSQPIVSANVDDTNLLPTAPNTQSQERCFLGHCLEKCVWCIIAVASGILAFVPIVIMAKRRITTHQQRRNRRRYEAELVVRVTDDAAFQDAEGDAADEAAVQPEQVHVVGAVQQVEGEAADEAPVEAADIAANLFPCALCQTPCIPKRIIKERRQSVRKVRWRYRACDECSKTFKLGGNKEVLGCPRSGFECQCSRSKVKFHFHRKEWRPVEAVTVAAADKKVAAADKKTRMLRCFCGAEGEGVTAQYQEGKILQRKPRVTDMMCLICTPCHKNKVVLTFCPKHCPECRCPLRKPHSWGAGRWQPVSDSESVRLERRSTPTEVFSELRRSLATMDVEGSPPEVMAHRPLLPTTTPTHLAPPLTSPRIPAHRHT